MKLKMINLQDTSNYISYLFDKAWVFLFPILCFILRFLLSVHFDYDILRDSDCLSGVSFLKFAREIGLLTVRLDPLRMPGLNAESKELGTRIISQLVESHTLWEEGKEKKKNPRVTKET